MPGIQSASSSVLTLAQCSTSEPRYRHAAAASGNPTAQHAAATRLLPVAPATIAATAPSASGGAVLRSMNPTARSRAVSMAAVVSCISTADSSTDRSAARNGRSAAAGTRRTNSCRASAMSLAHGERRR